MEINQIQCKACGRIFYREEIHCPQCGSSGRIGRKNKVPTSLDKSYRLIGLVTAFVVGTILDLMIDFVSAGFFFLMPPTLMLIGYCLGLILDKNYEKSDQYKKDLNSQIEYQKNTNEYNRKIAEITEENKIKYEIPKNTRDYKEISYLRGLPEFNTQMKLFTWIKDNNLHLVHSDLGSNCKGEVKILIDKIKSFTIKGDIRTETRITGGGGGGSSIKGAVIGEVIAGPAGAIIGSRKKNEAIKTENVVIDERETIMEIDYKGQRKFLFFDSKTYDVLIKMIPQKEISFVISNNESNANSNITPSF